MVFRFFVKGLDRPGATFGDAMKSRASGHNLMRLCIPVANLGGGSTLTRWVPAPTLTRVDTTTSLSHDIVFGLGP